MTIIKSSPMKLFSGILIIILALLFNGGCKGKSGSGSQNEVTSIPDTGFTGIKKYMSGNHITMETTFKNGVKDGLTSTYYPSGKLRGTMWYENGLREDSARWYFEEGQLFRATPYKRDTIDGIQQQYFRAGMLKARLGYKKGLRTFEFEEYDKDGKKIGGYPEIIVNARDEYKTNGKYIINLSLSDKSAKVKYYYGDFGSGVLDTTKCVRLKEKDGTGILELKKTGTPHAGSVDVVAAIITFYGNSYLELKKIDLPYKDLN